jgi:Fe-S oxidoreductase
VLLHAHCYQKAQPPAPDGFPSGAAATVSMLQAVGCTVRLIDAGCCGMAGAFGYEAEHYALSMQIGEQRLFPAVRAASPETRIATCGASCQPQIADGTGRAAVHPIQLLFE